jgi:hypothetical protein
MMDQLGGLFSGVFTFANDPFILILLGVIGLASVYIYMAYTSMKNNPYLMDSVMKRFVFNFVKKKYKVITVSYIRLGHNNSIIIQAIRRELLGNKGLYLEYLDECVTVPSEYFVTGAGEDDLLYYVITENGLGYPIKMELIKEVDEASLDGKEKMIAGLLASKKKHDLFTSQHFKALAQGVRNRVGRGKTQLDRLLESGIPAIFIITIALSFLLLYNFAMDSQKTVSNNVNEYTSNAFLMQNTFMERDRYCQVFISRYGTQTELDKYLSMPTGFEHFSDDGGET